MDYSFWSKNIVNNYNSFSLDVVSKHPDFNDRPLKKYNIDGMDTVGVFGNEAFEIHFKNGNSQDVQVRVSLDGTDVLTGKPADLEINHSMWLVKAGRTLHLKAWAENNQGGARFVFTDGEKGVALNAHGDVSHKGIISVAVFTENGAAPVRTYRDTYVSSFDLRRDVSDEYLSFNGPAAAASGGELRRLTKSSAAVGAGEYVEQKTHTVKGLNNPLLYSIMRVRYVWYDDLVQMVKNNKEPSDPYPTGFPGDKVRKFADLTGVPRVESSSASMEKQVPRF